MIGKISGTVISTPPRKGNGWFRCVPKWVVHMSLFTNTHAHDFHTCADTGRESGLLLPFPQPQEKLPFPMRKPSLMASFKSSLLLKSWANVLETSDLGAIWDCCILIFGVQIDWLGPTSNNFPYISFIRKIVLILYSQMCVFKKLC